MKKLIFASVVLLYYIIRIQSSFDSLERAIDDSIELNDEHIILYERRIKENDFIDEQYKKNYIDSYSGFLNWVTNHEYRQLDPEFDERLGN